MKTLQSEYINVNGSLLDLSSPCVMGILNVTPDSFYAGSRMQTEVDIAHRVEQIVAEGARILMSVPTLRAQTLRMYLPGRKWNVYAWGWAS